VKRASSVRAAGHKGHAISVTMADELRAQAKVTGVEAEFSRA